jgi:hypothetical protein
MFWPLASKILSAAIRFQQTGVGIWVAHLTPVKFPDISGIKPVDASRIDNSPSYFALILEDADRR